MGIKRIAKIRKEYIRTRAGVANIIEKISLAELRCLGHVERKTVEGVVMRTWMMGVGGLRKIGITKLRWGDGKRKYMREKGVKYGRSTRPETVEIENSMRQPQVGKRPKMKNVLIHPRTWLIGYP